jgi:oxalyl-CoA decarboxylase
MIQISGSSERSIIDLQHGDYEELDQLNAAKPVAKAAFRVDRAQDIGLGVARAIRAAMSGRPGGVYLDLPAAVLKATMPAGAGQASVFPAVHPAPALTPAPESITRAMDLLAGAQRPLIILGKGAAYARAEHAITTFIESTGVPYLPTSMARGLLPVDHPQSAATARSLVLGQAEVVMLIGARLNWLPAHGQPPRWSAGASRVDRGRHDRADRPAGPTYLRRRFPRTSKGEGDRRKLAADLIRQPAHCYLVIL